MKIANLTTSLIFLLGILSCSKTTEKKKVLLDFEIPHILDTATISPYSISFENKSSAWYDIERMDTISDTLDLTVEGKNRKDLWFENYRITKPHRYLNHGLQVIVDTVHEVNRWLSGNWGNYEVHGISATENSIDILKNDTLIKDIKSYPVYVVNLSPKDSAIIHVQDNSLMMLVEARDSSGRWETVEYWLGSSCGNSYYSVILPPYHQYMTRVVKRNGEFKTRCRLKLFNYEDTIYSNEFNMSINPNEFSESGKSHDFFMF